VLGGVGLVAGIAVGGWYLVAREPQVVVTVSGEDPVRLPVSDDADADTVTRVRRFLAEA
jgi:hypothetical protein